MPTVIYVNKLKDSKGPFIGLSRVVLLNGKASLRHVRNIRDNTSNLDSNPSMILNYIACTLEAADGLKGPFTFYDSQTGQKYEY